MNAKQLKYNHSDSDCSSVYTVLACPSVGIKQLMIKQIKPLLARGYILSGCRSKTQHLCT